MPKYVIFCTNTYFHILQLKKKKNSQNRTKNINFIISNVILYIQYIIHMNTVTNFAHRKYSMFFLVPNIYIVCKNNVKETN